MYMAEATPSLDTQRQTTLDLLKGLTPTWLDLKLRNERGLGGDPAVKRDYAEVYAHTNDLLDQLGVTDGIPA